MEDLQAAGAPVSGRATRGRLGLTGLSRNAVHMLASQGLQVLLQGLQFVLLARVLGPTEFGRVAGALAFTSALLPFSGLGLANMAIMHIARGESLPALEWGNAIAVTVVTGLLAAVIAVALCTWFLGPGMVLIIALFAVSELLVTKSVDVAAHVHFGLEQHGTGALFYNLLSGIRLVCSLLLFAMPSADAATWAALHLAAGAVALLVVGWLTVGGVGRPRLKWSKAWRDARGGAMFSVALSAKSVYIDVDKAVLARYVDLATTGAYTAAYRLAFMAYLPVVSLILTLQARLFRAGGDGGINAVLQVVSKLATLALAYGGALAVVIYFSGPLLPLILGSAYTLSGEMLQWFALLPLALTIRGLSSETLVGAEGPRRAGWVHAVAAVAAVVLNLALVPSMSWHGAIIAAYAAQLLLIAMLLGTLFLASRNASRPVRQC